MICKRFRDLKLSGLGMGTMRLPVVEGKNDQIDEAAAARMVAAALEHGINYFDTAWGYHEGNSETVMGKLLSRYPRDRFFLASKFPGFDAAKLEKKEEIFEKQLEKCRVEYFDFYLIHNVCEANIENYLDEKYGLFPYLMAQKEKGRIGHLGFSVHGSLETMQRFLDKWGQYMEFCQIQLNYIDWSLQKAGEKVALLNRLGLPIWVMEPLRGGKLAALPERAAARLHALRPDEGVPAWAFRYLQGIPGVTMILSGMSDYEQMMDNLHTFETERPLNGEEREALREIAQEMLTGVPCTACRYCTSYCPQGLDIPKLLELYNECTFSGGGFLAPMFVSTLPPEKRPDACRGCGSCETVCPQQIRIPEVLADFAARLAEKQ